MNDATPQRKVVAGGLAGAVCSIVLWLLNTAAGITVPGEIAVAIYTLIVFAVQYLVPNAKVSNDEASTSGPAPTVGPA